MPQFDFITFGAGLSGLIPAVRAAQLELSVCVLEQETEERHLCNSRYTTGVGNVAYFPLSLPENELLQIIDDATGGHADPDLARVYAATAGRALHWLRGESVRFTRPSIGDNPKEPNWVLAPARRFNHGLDWQGNGGDVTLQLLERNLKHYGGELHRGVKVTALLEENGTCTGLMAEKDNTAIQYDAKAVAVADGGFMANQEMVREHIANAADKVLVRSAPNVRGDGMLMAQAIGAELFGLGNFYGHLQHRDAMTNEKLWPYPTLDALAQAAVIVGADGQRFADEGRGGVPLANDMAKMDDPLSATLILDAQIWRSAGKIGPVGADPYLERGGGWKWEAASLTELASLANLPADVLESTVAAYNDAHTKDALASLDPVRTTAKFKAHPIVEPPFYAIPLCAGITGTMGGLRIDGNARVLRPDGSVIGGLYAAGTTTGGLEGGPNVAYMGGLSKAYIWGLLAGEHAAGYAGAE